MDESTLLTLAAAEQAAAALARRVAALEAALRDVLAHPDTTTEAGYAAYLRAHTLLADYATGYPAESAAPP